MQGGSIARDINLYTRIHTYDQRRSRLVENAL